MVANASPTATRSSPSSAKAGEPKKRFTCAAPRVHLHCAATNSVAIVLLLLLWQILLDSSEDFHSTDTAITRFNNSKGRDGLPSHRGPW